jgi:hypothetical protein
VRSNGRKSSTEHGIYKTYIFVEISKLCSVTKYTLRVPNFFHTFIVKEPTRSKIVQQGMNKTRFKK